MIIDRFKTIFMPNMLHFVNLYGTIDYRVGISARLKTLQVLLCSCLFDVLAQKLASTQRENIVVGLTAAQGQVPTRVQ